MNATKLHLSGLLALAFPLFAAASAPVFSPFGQGVTLVQNGTGPEAITPDGKLLAVTYGDSAGAVALGRYLADGAPDPTFDASTLGLSYLDTIIALPDGKTLLAGSFGSDAESLVRLNPDGSMDSAFHSVAIPFDYVDDLEPLPDDGAVIGGYLSGDDSEPYAILRADGGGGG